MSEGKEKGGEEKARRLEGMIEEIHRLHFPSTQPPLLHSSSTQPPLPPNNAVGERVGCLTPLLRPLSLPHLQSLLLHVYAQPEMAEVEEKLNAIGDSKYAIDYLDELLECELDRSFPVYLHKFTGEKMTVKVTEEMTVKRLKVRIEHKFREELSQKARGGRGLNWRRVWGTFALMTAPEPSRTDPADLLHLRGVKLLGDLLPLSHFHLKAGDHLFFSPHVDKSSHARPYRYRNKKKRP